jgi:hypothetical protein
MFCASRNVSHEVQEYFKSQVIDTTDLLAAAAVTGCVSAAQDLIEQDAKVLSYPLETSPLGLPITIAVSKLEVLRLLLHRAETEIADMGPATKDTERIILRTIEPAIAAAAEAQLADSAILLIEFARQHCPKTIKSRYYGAVAASGGSIQLVDYILLYKSSEKSDVVNCACEYGHVALVQHLLNEKIMTPPPSLQPLPRNYVYPPLKIAMWYGHRAVFNLLVEHGADPPPSDSASWDRNRVEPCCNC